MMRVRVHDAESGEQRMRQLPDSEAIALLREGTGVLDPRQPEPPQVILELLHEQISGPYAFGPSIDAPKLLASISDTLIVNGIRQRLAEGHPLQWVQGHCQLIEVAEARLLRSSAFALPAFRTLQEVLNAHLSETARRVSLKHVTPEEMRERRLIKGRTGNLLRGTWDYFRVDVAWYAFYEGLTSLDDRLAQHVRSAFRDARILCVEELTGGTGARLLHPSQTAGETFKGAQWFFHLTSDLPTDLLNGQMELPMRKKLASDWMRWAIEYLATLERRPTSEQLMLVAQEKYRLSENAAKSVWSKLAPEFNLPKGNFPDALKVSIEEIRAINMLISTQN